MAMLSLRGADKLRKKLKNTQELQAVQIIVRLNVAEMMTVMIRMAAVDTGYMRSSIRIQILDNGMTVMVRPNAHYSPYVEYGTRFMEAQPFVRPAHDHQEPIFIGDLRRLMK